MSALFKLAIPDSSKSIEKSFPTAVDGFIELARISEVAGDPGGDLHVLVVMSDKPVVKAELTLGVEAAK